MASRSSQSGKRRRAAQPAAPAAGRSPAGGRGGSRPGSAAAPPATAGPRGHNPGAGGTPAGASSLAAPLPAPPAGTVLIYGRNPVREALRGRRKVHAIWLAPGALGEDLGGKLSGWAAEGGRPAPEVRHASPSELTAFAGSPDHQGIVAAVDPFAYVDPQAILRDFTLLVALDEVQDPHNLGAIIRTAEGAGAGIVIPRHRAAEVTAAVVKASAGATEHAAIAQVRNLADFLGAAKQAGFWIYGAAAQAASTYTDQDYRYNTCFVVGSEGQGLGRRVESLCDVMINLPLTGKVDSLNVSVSSGILLYEAVRQRRAAGAEAAAPSQTAAPTAPPEGLQP